jgi:3'-phosphoadenosine 5'-phosphosulfate sulfotransferase (PAPS reductase)/FAD synthetase
VAGRSFRRISGPYEAVMLHLAVQAQPDIPVLWVDHGYNRPATYRHADGQLRATRLGLNLKPYLPADDGGASRRDARPDSGRPRRRGGAQKNSAR